LCMDYLYDLQGTMWNPLFAASVSATARTFLTGLATGRPSHLYLTGAIFFFAIETALITVLIAARKRATRTRTLLDRRFAIEAAIARCSARLSACPAARVDFEIEEGLRAIVESEEIDMASWFVFDSSSAAHVYSAHVGMGLPSTFYTGLELPWVTQTLLQDEPVVLSSLDQMPAEAQSERVYLANKSIKAAAFIPCGSGMGLQGVLTLVRLSDEVSWPNVLVERLSVLGNIFAGALMRKRAQQAEEESEQRFRYLFEEAPIGIAIENVDGKILFANPALCSILGYDMNEIVGMNCCQFSDPDAEGNDWDQFQQLRAGLADTYRMEKRYRRKDGTRIWGRVNVTMLRNYDERQPVVVATVEDISAAKRATAELNELNTELRQLTTRLIQSQEVERQRIARELHDDISQRLALLMMDIDAWQGEIPFQRTSDHSTLRRVMAQLDELSTDVHNLSHRLHSTKLQHLGLQAALQELCQQFSSRHSILIELNAQSVPQDIPEMVSLCFYRIAQEALKNAVKHSGSPRIDLRIICGEQTLCMHVVDFGTGFDVAAPSAGLGLMTMQERLRMVGGKLRINSVPESGTEVIAEVPIERSSMVAKVA
jgi:PAS domain S-box-containing protein